MTPHDPQLRKVVTEIADNIGRLKGKDYVAILLAVYSFHSMYGDNPLFMPLVYQLLRGMEGVSKRPNFCDEMVTDLNTLIDNQNSVVAQARKHNGSSPT